MNSINNYESITYDGISDKQVLTYNSVIVLIFWILIDQQESNLFVGKLTVPTPCELVASSEKQSIKMELW